MNNIIDGTKLFEMRKTFHILNKEIENDDIVLTGNLEGLESDVWDYDAELDFLDDYDFDRALDDVIIFSKSYTCTNKKDD